MILTKLGVTNLRAIGPGTLEVPVRPLTVFVGKNGTGKSSLLDALALTAQSATQNLRLMDLVVDGTIWRRSEKDPAELAYRRNSAEPMSVTLAWSIDEDDQRSLVNLPAGYAGKPELAWPLRTLEYTWERRGRKFPSWRHIFRLDGLEVWNSWSDTDSTESFPASKHWLRLATIPEQGPWATSRPYERVLPPDTFFQNRSGIITGLVGPATSANRDPPLSVLESLDALAGALGNVSKLIFNWLNRVSLLAPLRGSALAEDEVSSDVTVSVGEHGENVLRLLSSVRAGQRGGLDKVRQWAKQFGLENLAAGLEGKRLQLSYRDPESGTELGHRDAATGSYQGLVLAAQLLLSEPGATLLLEEPENNLHPQFERDLPRLFADSIDSGHQLIVTTHSEVLVAAIGNAVRRGHLKPEQVAIFELEKGKQGVVANELKVGEKGLRDWVASFGAVNDELFQEWMDELPEDG